MNVYEIKTENGSKFVVASTPKIAINKAFGVSKETAIKAGLMQSIKNQGKWC